MDEFLLCQLLSGLLQLSGCHAPPHVLAALEAALLRVHQEGGDVDAPGGSWRRLARAYADAGLPGPTLPELARMLVMLA
eukprot:263114-Chlamydomonas_euryale.AAC.5